MVPLKREKELKWDQGLRHCQYDDLIRTPSDILEGPHHEFLDTYDGMIGAGEWTDG